MLEPMSLLAMDDPVFVVDLSPETMEACRRDFCRDEQGSARPASAVPPPPERPIRAIALLFSPAEEQPLLLPIPPTRDTVMLDATARLIRSAALTGRSLADLAIEHGDESLRRLYRSGRLPEFIYVGLPEAALVRIPEGLRWIFAGPRRGASG